MNTLEAIKSRRSIRNFAEKPLEGEKLQTILEAAAFAPAGGDVEVHYSVVRNKEVLTRLGQVGAAVLNEKPGFDPFYGAGTVVILSADPNPIACDLANAAVAAENMLLAATELGVASIYLLAFVLGLKDNAELLVAAGVPQGKVPQLGIALGYTEETMVTMRDNKIKNVVYVD